MVKRVEVEYNVERSILLWNTNLSLRKYDCGVNWWFRFVRSHLNSPTFLCRHSLTLLFPDSDCVGWSCWPLRCLLHEAVYDVDPESRNDSTNTQINKQTKDFEYNWAKVLFLSQSSFLAEDTLIIDLIF